MKHNFSFKYDGKEINNEILDANGVCEVSKETILLSLASFVRHTC